VTQDQAYGVKVYPPAGYRPTENKIPHRPVCFFTDKPGMEWDYRYKSNGKRISNAELNHRLLELLCWCAKNNIPVFAHSGYGEFQARSGYGQTMPNPRWWKDLLDGARQDHPELVQLRLCFAHAGGADSFFGGKDYKAWSETVVDLCRRYPNIYCEVGCLDQILDAKKQAAFAMAMVKWCHAPRDAVTNRYDFSSKIMYGSDWYMPISSGVDRKQFLKAYQQVFLLPQLREFYQKFCYQNALEYLDAKNRIANSQFPIAEQTKSELQALLAQGH
jgi:predicted TIM-barrel fold metal-dependent hydrolase